MTPIHDRRVECCGKALSMRQWLDFQAQLGPTWYRQTRNMWLWPSLSVVSFHEQ